jgi:predicted Zn finger-like uncharacterized protein
MPARVRNALSEKGRSIVIQFKCPHCQKAFRVDDSYAGKQAKCSACEQQMIVPGASASPPATTQHQQDDSDALAFLDDAEKSKATTHPAASAQVKKAAAKKATLRGPVFVVSGLTIIVLSILVIVLVPDKQQSAVKPTKQTIWYEVLKKWDSEPNLTDKIFGMDILVAEGASHQDVQNLVENLDSDEKNVRINIFDSRDAWQVNERDKSLLSEMSDEEYEKYGRRVLDHWRLQFFHTANNPHKLVRWLAEEGKANEEEEKEMIKKRSK